MDSNYSVSLVSSLVKKIFDNADELRSSYILEFTVEDCSFDNDLTFTCDVSVDAAYKSFGKIFKMFVLCKIIVPSNGKYRIEVVRCDDPDNWASGFPHGISCWKNYYTDREIYYIYSAIFDQYVSEQKC